MQNRIFYAVCFGFVLGVLVRSLVFVNIFTAIFILVISLAIFLASYFTKLKWGVIFSLFVFAFSLGIFRFHLADQPASQVFESQVGQPVNLTGEIIDEPDIREANQKLTVNTKLNGVETKVLVSADLGEDLKYGDDINFQGS